MAYAHAGGCCACRDMLIADIYTSETITNLNMLLMEPPYVTENAKRRF